jgi:hypothetical protein
MTHHLHRLFVALHVRRCDVVTCSATQQIQHIYALASTALTRDFGFATYVFAIAALSTKPLNSSKE